MVKSSLFYRLITVLHGTSRLSILTQAEISKFSEFVNFFTKFVHEG